jgi:hypothetical protein
MNPPDSNQLPTVGIAMSLGEVRDGAGMMLLKINRWLQRLAQAILGS